MWLLVVPVWCISVDVVRGWVVWVLTRRQEGWWLEELGIYIPGAPGAVCASRCSVETKERRTEISFW